MELDGIAPANGLNWPRAGVNQGWEDKGTLFCDLARPSERS